MIMPSHAEQPGQGLKPDYRAYLLRMWQAGGQERPVWRASLEDATSGERQVFSEIADLVAFLESLTGAQREQPGPPPKPTEDPTTPVPSD
jgi:hypothetical protein